jgi:hypothetical protein
VAHPSTILLSGFLLGLIVRVAMLFYEGVSDMPAYYEWGRATRKIGLAQSFHGTYFPFQYQVFQVCWWATHKLHLSLFVGFKLANLGFDIGGFVLLTRILQRAGLPRSLALVYWLHPWFLLMSSLGYVDVQFSCVLLLTIYLLYRGQRFWDYFLAGLPLRG